MNEVADLKFYFMHDNHTFSELKGDSIDVIINSAKKMAKKSLYGCIYPAFIRNTNKRVGEMVHADRDKFKQKDLDSYINSIKDFCDS